MLRYCTNIASLFVILGQLAIVAGVTAQDLAMVQITRPASSSDYVSANGASLDDLNARMLASNLELLAARTRVAQAEARVLQSGLRPNPAVEFQHNNDRLLTNSGEREDELTVHQPLEIGGRRGRRIDLARAGVERMRYEVAELERQRTADLATLVGQALGEADRLYALERITDLNETLRTATNLRVKAGDASRYEFALTEAEAVRIESEMLRARSQLDSLMIEIKTLAGVPLTEPIKLREGQLDVTAMNLSLDEAVGIAFDSRPDLKASRVAEQEAEARIKLAAVEGKPDVGAIFGFKRPSVSVGGFEASDWQLKVGVSVSLPVFNRNQGAIREAAAALEEARLHRQSLEQLIRRDVVIAHRRVEQARRDLKLYEDRLVPLAQGNVRMARLGFEMGELRLVEYINEQRRLSDYESGYAQAKAELFKARVELGIAVGKRL
ncbi:MAG TPA: TolC family protein [Blastocatellia bacterium]|nr:TolC family protein [Blastocatellia bacterium]